MPVIFFGKKKSTSVKIESTFIKKESTFLDKYNDRPEPTKRRGMDIE